MRLPTQPGKNWAKMLKPRHGPFIFWRNILQGFEKRNRIFAILYKYAPMRLKTISKTGLRSGDRRFKYFADDVAKARI